MTARYIAAGAGVRNGIGEFPHDKLPPATAFMPYYTPPDAPLAPTQDDAPPAVRSLMTEYACALADEAAEGGERVPGGDASVPEDNEEVQRARLVRTMMQLGGASAGTGGIQYQQGAVLQFPPGMEG